MSFLLLNPSVSLPVRIFHGGQLLLLSITFSAYFGWTFHDRHLSLDSITWLLSAVTQVVFLYKEHASAIRGKLNRRRYARLQNAKVTVSSVIYFASAIILLATLTPCEMTICYSNVNTSHRRRRWIVLWAHLMNWALLSGNLLFASTYAAQDDNSCYGCDEHSIHTSDLPTDISAEKQALVLKSRRLSQRSLPRQCSVKRYTASIGSSKNVENKFTPDSNNESFQPPSGSAEYYGAAAEYYGDCGESVHRQPGVRPPFPWDFPLATQDKPSS